ncbi:MAG TPA: pantoate--beta-alanine ligase [Aquifex aeolicus]|uniref:Pantothenate synthetase n=1 Tax=Aquifex aeolicus TaxID=63363 RepID=A0A9D0YNP1_AQUAO|nr:pantoate--beta-alanine ligase [Aquifex aeolicus]
MQVFYKPNEVKEFISSLKREGKTIGFVPTMGYLHKGHLSLVRCSKRDNDITVVSIFVNPTQFGKNEDYDRYPRDLQRDLNLLQREGVDIVLAPSVEDMYPKGYSTYVEETELSKLWEGTFRPGHFRGVCTVVTKLFNIVKPDKAYFGEKDYQQLKIIQKMVKDLNMDIEVIGCPIVRDSEGLAMSSRNVYLSPEERKQATAIYKSFKLAQKLVEEGLKEPRKLEEEIKKFLASFPLIKKIDYVAVVNPNTLEPAEEIKGGERILVAVRMPSARLIDNWELKIPKM